MLEVKQRSSRSWFDPSYSRALAAQLADRLARRCAGERGVFITLTYRRGEWENPAQLFRASSEQRHVREFVRRLSAFVGESLTARWICKLEFQHGGWVHFHVIVLGLSYVDQRALTELWGWGHVWINRLDKRRVRYLCKYVAKDDHLPAFLYAEPMRSVKVIRSSPGFWPPEDEATPATPTQRSSQAFGYVTIGQSLERCNNRVVVRDEDTGRYSDVPVSLYRMLHDLRRAGAVVVASCRGWLAVDGLTWEWVDRLSGRKRHGRPAKPGGHDLHLTEGGDPHNAVWLDRYFAERSSWLSPSPSVEGGV